MHNEPLDHKQQLERLKSFDLTIKLMLILFLLASRLAFLYGFPPSVYFALAATAVIGYGAKMGMFWLLCREWIV